MKDGKYYQWFNRDNPSHFGTIRERGGHFFGRELSLAIDPQGRTLRPIQFHPVELGSGGRAMTRASRTPG